MDKQNSLALCTSVFSIIRLKSHIIFRFNLIVTFIGSMVEISLRMIQDLPHLYTIKFAAQRSI